MTASGGPELICVEEVIAMSFQTLTLDDIDIVRPFFQKLSSRTCDFSVGGMFMWRDYYGMEYTIENGIFYSRLRNSEGETYYNLPISDDIPNALTHIKQLLPPGKKLRFCTIPESYVSMFEDRFEHVRITEQTQFGDYLYRFSDLLGLRSKKYNGQRNQINQFLRANGTWELQPIQVENIDDVIAFFNTGYTGSHGAFADEENKKALEVLNNYEKYKLDGWAFLAGSAVVGFSLCERIGDTLYIHVEKADRNIKGAYQMLVNQVARRYETAGIEYINREEDMGDPGLATSKRSYHPLCVLKKFIVEVN